VDNFSLEPKTSYDYFGHVSQFAGVPPLFLPEPGYSFFPPFFRLNDVTDSSSLASLSSIIETPPLLEFFFNAERPFPSSRANFSFCSFFPAMFPPLILSGDPIPTVSADFFVLPRPAACDFGSPSSPPVLCWTVRRQLQPLCPLQNPLFYWLSPREFFQWCQFTVRFDGAFSSFLAVQEFHPPLVLG